MRKNSEEDELSFIWFLVANIIPPIGIFLYLKHKIQYPYKAKLALTGFIMGLFMELIGIYVLNR